MESRLSAGFTLIEILIAITILAFISLGIISVVENSTNTKERVTSEDNEKMQLLVGLSRMEWDFAHIYSPLYHGRYPDPDKATTKIERETWIKEAEQMRNNHNFFALSAEKYPIPTIHQENNNDIMFFTQGNRRRMENAAESEFAWVRYQVVPMESDGEEKEGKASSKGLSQLVRTFITENPFTPETIDLQNQKGQVVLDRLKELKFEFWDRDQKKYLELLKDMKEKSERNLYRSVKISFTWQDSTGNEEKFVSYLRPLFPYFKEEDLSTTSTSSKGTVKNVGGDEYTEEEL